MNRRLPKQFQSGYRPQEACKGDAVIVVPVRRSDSVTDGNAGEIEAQPDAAGPAVDPAEEHRRAQEEVPALPAAGAAPHCCAHRRPRRRRRAGR